jgi:hypothetical protein
MTKNVTSHTSPRFYPLNVTISIPISYPSFCIDKLHTIDAFLRVEIYITNKEMKIAME